MLYFFFLTDLHFQFSGVCTSHFCSTQATMAAWHSSRETTSLRYADADERFTLLWKLVLGFLDEPVDLDKLKAAFAQVRIAAAWWPCVMYCLLTSTCSWRSIEH